MGAPTARSSTPSPSRSPMPAAEYPNQSLSASAGPRAVRSFIFDALFAVPSELSSTMYRAPRSAPVAPAAGAATAVSVPCAPTAMSGIPSPSRSPVAATDEPKKSMSDRAGPPPVPLAIFVISSMEPSACIRAT